MQLSPDSKKMLSNKFNIKYYPYQNINPPSNHLPGFPSSNLQIISPVFHLQIFKSTNPQINTSSN